MYYSLIFGFYMSDLYEKKWILTFYWWVFRYIFSLKVFLWINFFDRWFKFMYFWNYFKRYKNIFAYSNSPEFNTESKLSIDSDPNVYFWKLSVTDIVNLKLELGLIKRPVLFDFGYVSFRIRLLLITIRKFDPSYYWCISSAAG